MTHSGAAEHEETGTMDLGAGDTRHTVRESGIPPAESRPSYERFAVDRPDACLEAALAESARSEANLNLLLRGLEQIVAGASAARDSNSMLSRELDALRESLARSDAEGAALRQRVRLLELAVDRARREAALERAFFLEQEDAFLAELLTDHEREVGELRGRLTEALARTPTSGVVRLGVIRIPRPYPTDPDETPVPPAPASARPTPVPYSSPPPATLPRASMTPAPSSKPPLAQKPDPTTRPLIGYSLREGDVAEERIETPSSRRT